MLVVGQSKVIMDMPEHVATGLIASGVVTRVAEEAAAGDGAPTQPPAVMLTKQPEGGPETPPEGDGGTIPAEDPAEAQEDGWKLPPGNGAREVWVEFALANGKTEDDLNGLTQTDIRNLFKPAAE